MFQGLESLFSMVLEKDRKVLESRRPFIKSNGQVLRLADDVMTSTMFESIEAPCDVVAKTLNRYFWFDSKPVTIRVSS